MDEAPEEKTIPFQTLSDVIKLMLLWLEGTTKPTSHIVLCNPNLQISELQFYHLVVELKTHNYHKPFPPTV